MRCRSILKWIGLVAIPNKDFLFTYRVAGDTMNDAVLTHRSERGGFFTLILQPPQRVTAEDVMPKELVFIAGPGRCEIAVLESGTLLGHSQNHLAVAGGCAAFCERFLTSYPPATARWF